MSGVRARARHAVARLRTRLPRSEEVGSVAPFVVIVSVGLLLLAGLVIDGGRQLNAKGIAIAYAQEAARAGAQAVNVADPSLGLLDSDAVSAAQNYCAQAQAGDSTLVKCVADIRDVTVNGQRTRAVEVETEIARPAIIIGMIGRETLTASGVAQARPISGIDAPDDSKLGKVPAPSVAPPGGGDETDGLPTTSYEPPTPSAIPSCPTEDPKDPPDPKPDDPKPNDPKPNDPKPNDPKPNDPKPNDPTTPTPPPGCETPEQ
jgi:hypothetical protein